MNDMPQRITAFFSVLLLLSISTLGTFILSGCGYTLQGSGTVLPPGVRKIYIPIVQNRSTDASLTSVVTEALRDRFERFGVVTVVDSLNDADAVLQIQILQIKRGTRTVTGDTETALQLNTSLNLSGELRTTTGKTLWRNPGISVSRGFGTNRSVVVTSAPDFGDSNLSAGDIGKLSERELSRGQEQEALNALADEAAGKIYDEAIAPEF